jgi:RND family efflux transporter MFP subunit
MPNAGMRLLMVAAVAGALALAACSQENHYVAPPPKVTVAPPVQRPVTRYLELTGNTAAVNSADLVARVAGFIQEINYQDGAFVKAGTLLFTIEPEPFEVKLAQAQAAEAGAQATLTQTQADFARNATLVTTAAASRQQYDQALAARDAARANFQQAQANPRVRGGNHDL